MLYGQNHALINRMTVLFYYMYIISALHSVPCSCVPAFIVTALFTLVYILLLYLDSNLDWL